MSAARYQAQQSVAGAGSEKLQGDRTRRVLLILVARGLTRTQRVEKWTHMDPALRVHKVDGHRACVGALAILFHRIVRCKKAPAGDDTMQCDEHDKPFVNFAGGGHRATGSVRILGSTQ